MFVSFTPLRKIQIFAAFSQKNRLRAVFSCRDRDPLGGEGFVFFVQLHEAILGDGLFIRQLRRADVVGRRLAEEQVVDFGELLFELPDLL